MLTNIPLSWRRIHAQLNLVLPRSFSLVRSLSLSLYLNVFLSLHLNQSRFSLVRHHCRCRSNISSPEFILISLSTTTPIFLAKASSSSFSLYNYINLFKIKVILLYFVGYTTIVIVGAKSLCQSFF